MLLESVSNYRFCLEYAKAVQTILAFLSTVRHGHSLPTGHPATPLKDSQTRPPPSEQHFPHLNTIVNLSFNCSIRSTVFWINFSRGKVSSIHSSLHVNRFKPFSTNRVMRNGLIYINDRDLIPAVHSHRNVRGNATEVLFLVLCYSFSEKQLLFPHKYSWIWIGSNAFLHNSSNILIN